MKIQTLTLLTNNLKEMKEFYHERLQLPLRDDRAKSFSVQIGASILEFKKNNDDTDPFYHFAMNIPRNKFREAKSWIRSITNLNTHNETDEVFFKNWNAYAVYFTDPAGNIVEFIARQHDSIQKSHSHFNSDQIINISEIGIVTNQVQTIAKQINKIGIENSRQGTEDFSPLGDVEGLFIIVKSNRIWFFSDQPASFFPVEIKVKDFGTFIFNKVDKVSI